MMFDAPSVARFIGLIVSLLAYFGVNVPENLSEAITAFVVAVFAVYAAFKNNYLTEKGQKQKQALEREGLTINKERNE
ncbi:phage holin [Bacillus sp. FSL K6-0047]